MSSFDVQIEKIDQAIVIRAVGSAGLAESDVLERKLDQVIVQQPALTVLDLSGLTLITSLGLGALTRFQRAIKRHGKLKLVITPGNVRDVLVRSRIIELFDQAGSVEEALKA